MEPQHEPAEPTVSTPRSPAVVGGTRSGATAVGTAPLELRTDRLLLRQLRPADRVPFAAMNADPEVMRFIGSGVLTAVASDELRARLRREWSRSGRGLWVLQRTSDAAFLGFCGLTSPAWGGPALQGEVEVGWRLRREAWGHGYASEAARAALGVAWDVLGLASAIALVHPGNERSLGVGERLGMRVVGTARHAPTGWDVLVLRGRRPDGHPRPDAAPVEAVPAAAPEGTSASPHDRHQGPISAP